MMDSPALFVVEGCEEGIVDCGADLDDWTAYVFLETLFIAQFFGEGGAGDEDDGLAEDLDLKDFA